MSEKNTEINIDVTFRHTESTPALKQYAQEKIENCIQKYLKYAAQAHVILSVEKLDHQAEVKLVSKGYDISLKANTEDLYSAIDKVVDLLDRQIRKQKGKIQDHKHQAAPSPV
jgi:putative sigma-54 modulation protein